MDRFHCRDLKVVYLKRYTSPKKCSRLFKPGHISVIIITSGEMVININGQAIILYPNVLLTTIAPIVIESIPKPLAMCVISSSMEFAITGAIAKFSTTYTDILIGNALKPVILNPDESEQLSITIGQLKKHLKLESHLFHSEIILLYFNLLLYKASFLLLGHQRNLAVVPRRKEKLFLQFTALTQRHCRKEHSVKFYADSLCITSGYLGKAIREIGGQSAKHFIEMAVVSEAYLLLGDQALTIAEIAEELSFSGTSSFSTFFKKIATVSPRAYRENILRNTV